MSGEAIGGETTDADSDDPIDPEAELASDEVPSKRFDAWITIAILVGAIGMLVQSEQFEAITLGSSADPGPVFWPRIVLAIVIVTALVNLGLTYRRLRADGKALLPKRSVVAAGYRERFTDLSTEERQFYLTIGLLIVYLLALEPVGYLTVTPLFLFAFAWVTGYRYPVKLAVTSLVVSFVIFVGFRIYMNIPLPYGDGPFRAFHLFVESLF